jgi:Fe-S cluster assembly protein SufD
MQQQVKLVMPNKTAYTNLLELDNVIALQDANLKVSKLMQNSVEIVQKNQTYIQIVIKENSVVTLTQLISNTPILETEIIAHSNSVLNYLLIINNTESTNFNLKQSPGNNSTINSYIFNYSTNHSQLNYICDFNEKHAKNNLHCLQNTKTDEIYSLNININHNKPNCTSTTQIRSIANDNSKIFITGKIYVAEHAIGTNANLQTKGILLSDAAEIYARPQLEIYNNEVQCTHGSAIGSLDAEEIFYLKSRGLNEIQAKKMLLDAFTAPTLPTELDLPSAIREIII